jgi:hypothetical protein
MKGLYILTKLGGAWLRKQSIHMNSASMCLIVPHEKREMNLTLNLLDDARGVLVIAHSRFSTLSLSTDELSWPNNSLKVCGVDWARMHWRNLICPDLYFLCLSLVMREAIRGVLDGVVNLK